jgi:hypothetical protein
MADGAGKVDQDVVAAVAEKTRNFGIKTPQQQKVAEMATKADNIFQYCLQGRRPYELEWFINDTFYRDRQVLRYNVNNKMLEPMPAEKAVSRINVNKAKQLTRGVLSYLTREHPMVNIIAGTQEDDAFSKAKKEQYLYEHWYDHLKLNSVHKKVAGQGGRHGIAWSKTIWNQDAIAPTTPFEVTDADGSKRTVKTLKGEVLVLACDNYSVYADWRATSKEDMRFINEAFPRTLGELASNQRYDQNAVDLISADDKSSLSTLKLESLTNGGGRTPEMANHADPMQRTVILRETYVREYDMDVMAWVINLYVTTQSNVLLYKDKWPIDEFPYEYYQTDVADQLYETDGVIKDIRGLQQALSRGASQVEETMQTMGKINWMIPRGSGVTVITDRTGQFVQYNAAAGQPTQSQAHDLPHYTESHMSNLERWIDDIGGIHDATYGKLPTSRASGDLVQALQSGDSTSLGIYKDNFADYIAREAKLMFKTAKYHYKGDRKVPLKADNGAGQTQWATVKASDIVLEDRVRVQVGTGLPYDQTERLKLAGDMVDKKWITPEQGLKLANIRALTDVMGDNQQDIDRQIEENRRMMKGEEVDDPYIFENHDTHIEIIDQLGKSDDWWGLSDEVKQAILDHRTKHMKLSISLKKLMASLNVEPIKRSESLMVRSSTTNDMTPIEKQQFYEKFGIDSDAAEIQLRGGLNVESAQEAVQQADKENNMLAQGFPSKVSLTDNHLVHMEVHNAYMTNTDGTPNPLFATLPKSVQKMMQEHMSDHQIALKATTPARGLMPNSETGDSVPNSPIKTAGMKKKAKAQQAEQGVPPQQAAAQEQQTQQEVAQVGG